MADGTDFLLSELYGFVPSMTPEMMKVFARGVLTIVGADGSISEGEGGYLVKLLRVLGASDAVLAWVTRFDPRSTSIEQAMGGFSEGEMARAVLYLAIKVSSIDGYDERERRAVAHAAKLLRIEAGIVAALEGVVAMEATLRTMKRRIFSEASA